MPLKNKGFSSVLVISLILVLLISVFGVYYFYKPSSILPSNKPQEEIIISKTFPKATLTKLSNNKFKVSTAFVEFELPSVDKKLAEELINSDFGKDCIENSDDVYNPKVVVESSVGNFINQQGDLNIIIGGSKGNPKCLGAPGPYTQIEIKIFNYEIFKNYISGIEKDLVKSDLSTRDLVVYENMSLGASLGRDYFFIENNKNPKGERLVLSISPVPGNDSSDPFGKKSIDYIYLRDLIKNMRLK